MQLNDVGVRRGGVVCLAATSLFNHRRCLLVFRLVGWRPDGRTLIATVLSLAALNVCLTTAVPVPGEYSEY